MFIYWGFSAHCLFLPRLSSPKNINYSWAVSNCLHWAAALKVDIHTWGRTLQQSSNFYCPPSHRSWVLDYPSSFCLSVCTGLVSAITLSRKDLGLDGCITVQEWPFYTFAKSWKFLHWTRNFFCSTMTMDLPCRFIDFYWECGYFHSFSCLEEPL